MTNKEILQADLLDILFENRNKAYGAYALRKNYNHRLGWALGIGLAISLLLMLLNFMGKKNSPGPDKPPDLNIISFELPKDKPKEIEKPSEIKEMSKMAEVKSVNEIRIVDDTYKTDIATQQEIEASIVSTKTVDGIPAVGIVKENSNPTNENEMKNSANVESHEKPQVFSQSDAQYPGGKEAFANFLRKYLVTPEELEPGEKKTVVVRFMVDLDGSISKTEIVQSGGDKYDKEVIRVLHKMPKWIPAMQNGFKMSSYFSQPVIFIGLE